MITGYNTDVRYREKVFHVQTEDKGLSNPSIESVVYHGGQVLATKRASYSDLVAEGKGSEAIAGRMEHQHRMMIAAIKGGTFKADDYGRYSFMKEGGCSLAPLGTFEGKVPAEVMDKVKKREADIKSGAATTVIDDNEPKSS